MYSDLNTIEKSRSTRAFRYKNSIKSKKCFDLNYELNLKKEILIHFMKNVNL